MSVKYSNQLFFFTDLWRTGERVYHNEFMEKSMDCEMPMYVYFTLYNINGELANHVNCI